MPEPTAGAAAASHTQDPTIPPGSAPPGSVPPEVERESVVDAAADLMQLFVQYLRQEAEALVRDKIALPIQNAGAAVAFAFAAAFFLVLGLCFLVAAELILLARWLTWPGSLGLNGLVLMIAAGGLTYARMRRSQ